MKYNNVIIIGNGFDVNLGLDTKYSDFLKSDEFFNCSSQMETGLGNYLKEAREKERWLDLEVLLKQFVCNEINLKPENFKIDFKILIDSMSSYLRRVQSKPMNFNSLAYKLFEVICIESTLIINFNYTHSIDQLSKLFKSNISHLQIHGNLTDKKIVVGVEDDAEIPDEFVFLRKGLNGYQGSSEIRKSVMDCSNLLIFGHSLGITDSSFFNDLFEPLLNDEKLTLNKKLTIFHYGDESKDKLNINLIQLAGKESIRKIVRGKFEFIDVEKISELPQDLLYRKKGFSGLEYL